MELDGVFVKSIAQENRIFPTENSLLVQYDLERVVVQLQYQLAGKELKWQVILKNTTDKNVSINHFLIWVSLAYIMFRDTDVYRNSQQSAAVFPSVSSGFTKIAAIRRDNSAPYLGRFQTGGEVLSVGTYNEFTNLFFENISPSLDGVLFHKIILASNNQGKKEAGSD
ncbi:TPA: hypothetical protein PCO36_004755 [Klebsiella oxytoca]|nr:hypothetical protein [Klebsiella oxytoca]